MTGFVVVFGKKSNWFPHVKVSFTRYKFLPMNFTVHQCACLDDFNFRWLENSVIEIGKAASIPLIFNHLNKKPSLTWKCCPFGTLVLNWLFLFFELIVSCCKWSSTNFLLVIKMLNLHQFYGARYHSFRLFYWLDLGLDR